MDRRSTPTVLLVGFLFGSTLTASRIGLQHFAPMTFSGLRLTLAALVYVVLYLVRPNGLAWPRDVQLWKHAALLGIFDTAAPVTLIILSLRHQSSGFTSILVAAGPAMTVLLAHVILPNEKLAAKKALGVGLAMGGAVLMGLLGADGVSSTGQANITGLFLVLGAHTCVSLMTIYARKHMQMMDAFQVGSARVIVASLLVMPIALVVEGFDLRGVNAVGVTALAYAAVPGTFLTMFLVFYNIKHFGATAAAMAMYVIPIVGSMSGILFLGESVTPAMIAGAALIMAGLTVIRRDTP